MNENNVTQCRDIVRKYEKKLQQLTTQCYDAYSAMEKVEVDPVSKLLMPDDVPVSLVPKHSKPDGIACTILHQWLFMGMTNYVIF